MEIEWGVSVQLLCARLGRAYVVLAPFAAFETDVRREQQLEGIAMAEREGVYQGGKLRLDRERVKEPSVNGLGPAAIARELGMARSSIYWLLEEAGQHANWAQPRGAASCGDYLKRNTLPGGSDCDRVMLEGRFPVATFEALGGLGHDAQAWPDFTFQCGAVCVVLHDSASGVKIAPADPRRNTGVAGW